MLYHASFPSRDPETAARALAELWNGRHFRFPVFPGSFIALKGDDKGTAVEFYPAGQVLVPGADEADVEVQHAPAAIETHLAIGVDITEEEVHAVAHREGWQVRTCWRGDRFFRVIEFWIDNLFMFEILTPEMQAEYARFATVDNFAAFAAHADAA
ncbi:MAG: hypothetical protein GC201_11145 [Alphaproteobacteria bacterium]|nr:hypothetical protein [Alphaproteobacteria bacterium]